MYRTFLCCLPVRLGTFVLSALQFMLSVVVAGSIWYVLVKDDVHFETAQKIAAYVTAVSWSLLAIFSFFGFIGTIIKKRSFVAGYARIITWHFILSVAAGTFYIITLFTESKDKFVNDCIGESTDQNVINLCHHTSTIRFVAMGIMIAGWIIEAYGVVIVRRYVQQLDDEDDERYRMRVSNRSYPYKHVRNGSSEALTHGGAYPYKDGAHSFGNSRA